MESCGSSKFHLKACGEKSKIKNNDTKLLHNVVGLHVSIGDVATETREPRALLIFEWM